MPNRTCTVDGCETAHSAKGMCNLHYQRMISGRPLVQEPKVERTECAAEGCKARPRSRFAQMCAKHYHRWYRHGEASKSASNADAPRVSQVRSYKVETCKGHPLARAHGRVYVHRRVLFDEIGPGEHPCHWCGKVVRWSTRGDQDGLYPDHLNGDGADNRVENLVPSCGRCNTTRGVQSREAALRAAGWWSRNDTVAALSKRSRADRVEESVA